MIKRKSIIPLLTVCANSENAGCAQVGKQSIEVLNRQKSEIEEFRERISYLEKSIDCSREEYNRLLQKLKYAQSESIKYFAERLKSRLANLSVRTKTYGRKTMSNYVDDIANQILHDVLPQEIDDLVKDMTRSDDE